MLVLTRPAVRSYLASITIAPITTNVRGVVTEVEVGPANGLDHPSVVSCDNVRTIDRAALGPLIGYLAADQEQILARAIVAAYDLRP
ncbi:type II toxin-antitoxin system PemK/MazF family toxin [Dactylosporangium sp. AC04546]|uniref:type II toxin-antitoxin system PemK/MazF family toxin n=1 Tax=Dactylosporangium sp. AC04546 TaxID=2862460 RepID=UPI002E7C0B1D|nr:type II toxin-antitoxin system PemK/MazF family toxin [Dactylosporangium sp. AC04546]WVK86222.1 type II toxin-antitoxin system PemK/MazF family toxin [Dactylosporangium sp. AC04546]